jgi:putative redox protein
MEFRLNGNGYETETGFGNMMISSDEQYGFRPFQLMVASVAGCSGTVMKKIFVKKRMNLEALTIKADVTRNPDKADRIEKIHMTFVVKAEGLDEKKMEKIVELTRKNCSMVQSVQDSIEITEDFQIL